MALQDIIEGKRNWRAHMARVKSLPKDYQIVFKEIQKYLFKVGPVDLAGGNLSTLYDLLELFEAGSTEGKKVLEVTGPDVAAFADGLIGDTATYTDGAMEKSDQKVTDSMRKWADK